MKKYKVLFCDMDGTLIETVSGETFPKGIWDMKFKFDILDAIKNRTSIKHRANETFARTWIGYKQRKYVLVLFSRKHR